MSPSVPIRMDRIGSSGLSRLWFLIPSLVFLVFVEILSLHAWHQSFFRSVPANSDEYTYWLAPNALLGSGFHLNFGYDETSFAQGIRFDAHGPFYAMFYGLWARLFGWYPGSIVTINMVLLIGAVVFYCKCLKARLQLILLACFLLSYWPLAIFSISHMSEILHYALATLITGMLYLIYMEKHGRMLPIITFLVIVLAAMARITHAVFFLPYFWFYLSIRNPAVKYVLSILAALIVSIPVYLVVTKNAAPFPYAPHPASFHFYDLLHFYRDKLMANTRQMFVEKRPIQKIFFFTIGLTVVYISGLFLINKIKKTPERKIYLKTVSLYMAVVLIIPLAATFITYDYEGYRAYRVISPYFLSLVLFMIILAHIEKRFIIIISIIVLINLSIFNGFYKEYQYLNSGRFLNREELDTVKREMRQAIPLKSPAEIWENTVLTTTNGPGLLALPRGISLQGLYAPKDASTIKSRYVLATPEEAGRFLNHGFTLACLNKHYRFVLLKRVIPK